MKRSSISDFVSSREVLNWYQGYCPGVLFIHCIIMRKQPTQGKKLGTKRKGRAAHHDNDSEDEEADRSRYEPADGGATVSEGPDWSWLR